ncbi:MAG: TlpA disulfide reductase family protein [Vicingaceae bacterium]|nr:TlpA disulfide reductase family protein [Vicingaceae bacterium]
MKNLIYIICAVFLFSCAEDKTLKEKETTADVLTTGEWHLNFKLNEDLDAPTNFSLKKTDSLYEVIFSNASEKITVTDVNITNNIITIKDPVFNNWFEGKIISPTTIQGFWIKNDTNYKVPFTANLGIQERFPKPEKLNEENADVSGKWEVHFSNNNPEDHYKAIGQFEQEGNKVTGTFMTETGDYRFLEGNVYNNKFSLSCYDGAHLFLFKAELRNDSLVGTFWSGTKWSEPWVGVKNDAFMLSNPDSLTYLKEGYTELAFNFPNTEGNNVSLKDEQFNNKVVIVNIMGPWCPNCKDETAYLAELHNNNNEKGLEVVALAFDRSEKATIIEKLKKIKSHFGANYDFLVAGTSDKKEAVKALPMLNHIMSYPTSIFIDRKGNIRKIRTGFYGPGTGDYYNRYIEKTNDFVAKLLAE